MLGEVPEQIDCDEGDAETVGKGFTETVTPKILPLQLFAEGVIE